MTQGEMTVRELDNDILMRLRRNVTRSSLLWVVQDCKDAVDEIKHLRAECDRLARRNTMLINELTERGRKFTPEQLQRAIVKAMYEGEG